MKPYCDFMVVILSIVLFNFIIVFTHFKYINVSNLFLYPNTSPMVRFTGYNAGGHQVLTTPASCSKPRLWQVAWTWCLLSSRRLSESHVSNLFLYPNTSPMMRFTGYNAGGCWKNRDEPINLVMQHIT